MSSAAGTTADTTPLARRRPPGEPGSVSPVVRWQLRELRRAPLTWGVPLAALCALEIAIYPSVRDSLADTVSDYPEALREAFNLTDIDTVEAFLNVEMFSLIVPLTLAFFAIRAAMRATVTAEEQGWLDIILTAPVSRLRLVAGAFAGTLVSLWLVLGVVAVVSELTGLIAGAGIPVDKMLAGIAGVWALAVFFSGVAVLAAGLVHRGVVVTAIATGALIGMYVLDLVGKLAPSIDWARYASAFRYYGSPLQDGLDLAAFAGLTLIGAAMAAAGALLFDRRDVLS